MGSKWTRRAALTAGLTVAGTALLATPPLTSLRPQSRPVAGLGVRPVARPDIAEIIRRSELGGAVGFVVRDLETGQVVSDANGTQSLPPASVTKAITSLYAIETMGPNFRYETKIYASGPIIDGVLEGDLILAGGADPTLDTKDLQGLRDTLISAGLIEVRGRFLVWGGAIQKITEIDPAQLDHLGYNPSVSGLNLNFNRVHFEWERQGTGYRVQMDARSTTEVPLVSMARMEIVDRGAPVFEYTGGDGTDRWTVARSALNSSGSRWLPVRFPALYAGDVFRVLCASQGLTLAEPASIESRPTGNVIATHQSAPLAEMMRRMLRFSTNLTAEAAGLTATSAQSGQHRGLRTSAFQMSQWVRERSGGAPSFDDHSGLSDASRISAGEMAQFLASPGVMDRLHPILKDIPFLDAKGNLDTDINAEVRAKTGTLNFVSTLAGYIKTRSGRDLSFAFFAADLEKRAQGKARGAERPAGSATYNTRAKLLQQTLLRRVVALS